MTNNLGNVVTSTKQPHLTEKEKKLMLITHEKAKNNILESWEWIKDATVPEDYVIEMADSDVPIYTSEIISEWVELPSEYSNRFSEMRDTFDSSITIENLMLDDLYLYYQFIYSGALAEILEAEGMN
jgi:hypothetical protein